MKKYLTVIFILSISSLCAYSAGFSAGEALSAVENSIFGYEVKNETELQRLERLENYMYGGVKTGTIQARIEQMQNDSGIMPEPKKAVKTKNPEQGQTLHEDLNDSISDGRKNSAGEIKLQNAPKEDDTVEYPLVDKMEQNLFHQTYKNENIYARLDRLENAVFQKTSNADLNTRTDRLAELLAVKPKRQSRSSYTLPDAADGFNQFDDESVPFQLALLENGILKREYINSSNTERLSRLEERLFSRTFPNDSDLQRVQRLTAAYEAKKNSRVYENNKRMQNMAAFSQIGGILLMILAILL